MTRAVEHIINVPSEDILRDKNLRIFLIAVLATIAYGPDHNKEDKYKELRKEFESIVGDMVELESALEGKFFTDLYVDRVEREEIENMLTLDKFILVHGLVGAGKSTLFRRIKISLDQSAKLKFIYLDMAAMAAELESRHDTDFIGGLQEKIFNQLYGDFIQKSSLSNEWDIFVIQEDPNYAHVLQKVNSIMGHPVVTGEDWLAAYEHPEIRRKFNETNTAPQLLTLLQFLKNHYVYSLCFDNIDRLSIEPQKRIITFCNDLNKNLGISILLAIRETNLRRLRTEAVELRKSGDDLAEIQFINYLERLEAGKEPSFFVGSVNKSSVKALLKQRIQFVQSHKNLSAISEFLDEFLKSFTEENVNLPKNKDEFEIRFWDIFDIIADTFVDEDVYVLCNHSIREMLRIYFMFINALLLSTEKEYNLRKIFQDESQIRITKLRNYFYKYVLCKGKMLPDPKCAFPPILSTPNQGLFSFDIDILQYCYNFERRNPEKRLRYKELWQVFKRFGVNEELLTERIQYLLKPHGIQDMGLIMLDGDTSAIVGEDTPIQLQPSGGYYIEKISTSREFIFWNALCSDLDPPIHEGAIEYSETYSDEFKYKIVLRFIRHYLLPKLQNELEHFNANLHPPSSWVGSKIDYYRSNFAHSGKFYITRIIESSKSTITHASMPTTKHWIYRRRFQELEKTVNQAISKYVNLYSEIN